MVDEAGVAEREHLPETAGRGDGRGHGAIPLLELTGERTSDVRLSTSSGKKNFRYRTSGFKERLAKSWKSEVLSPKSFSRKSLLDDFDAGGKRGAVYGHLVVGELARELYARLANNFDSIKENMRRGVAKSARVLEDRDNFAIIAIKEPLQPFRARYDIINLPQLHPYNALFPQIFLSKNKLLREPPREGLCARGSRTLYASCKKCIFHWIDCGLCTIVHCFALIVVSHVVVTQAVNFRVANGFKSAL